MNYDKLKLLYSYTMIDDNEFCKWLTLMYQYSCHQVATQKLIQSKDHKGSGKVHSIINQHLEQHTLPSAATIVHTNEWAIVT